MSFSTGFLHNILSFVCSSETPSPRGLIPEAFRRAHAAHSTSLRGCHHLCGLVFTPTALYLYRVCMESCHPPCKVENVKCKSVQITSFSSHKFQKKELPLPEQQDFQKFLLKVQLDAFCTGLLRHNSKAPNWLQVWCWYIYTKEHLPCRCLLHMTAVPRNKIPWTCLGGQGGVRSSKKMEQKN